MARQLLKPYKTSQGASAAVMLYNSTAFTYWQKLCSSGFYIKTGGSSRIDPSRLVFLVSRNSSKCTTAGILSFVAGSTLGGNDYFPGAYTTLNALNITIPVASGYKANAVSAHNAIVPLFVSDLSKYMDSNDYLNINVSGDLTSSPAAGKTSAASLGGKILALYLHKGGH